MVGKQAAARIRSRGGGALQNLAADLYFTKAGVSHHPALPQMSPPCPLVLNGLKEEMIGRLLRSPLLRVTFPGRALIVGGDGVGQPARGAAGIAHTPGGHYCAQIHKYTNTQMHKCKHTMWCTAV